MAKKNRIRFATPSNPAMLDRTGMRYGKLTVLGFAGSRLVGKTMPKTLAFWWCKCDCGKLLQVRASNLTSGTTMACGCRRVGRIPQHGQARRASKTPEWETWTRMRRRCESSICPDYPRYGGRGIKVCQRWQTFENFFADMGPKPSRKHSIDRIDNDGNYEPGNCRWATAEQQRTNTRRNRFFTHNGETHCLSDWVRILGFKKMTLEGRLDRGMSFAEAISLPIKKTGRRHVGVSAQ